MNMNRRDFLRNGAIAALGLGIAQPVFAKSSLLGKITKAKRMAPLNQRVVVVINLQGGNDGINTVIPLNQYTRYRQLRNAIGFDKADILPLSRLRYTP